MSERAIVNEPKAGRFESGKRLFEGVGACSHRSRASALVSDVVPRPDIVRASPIDYRPDIDGLRAVSVVLVLLFHLGLGWAGGGFVGVDVFFVISGFLITGVIARAVEHGTFSLAWFYDRRARRILPALLVVVVASTAAGAVFLYPGDYHAFARSAAFSLAALSNLFFMNNTGYFDIPSQSMPLLHTWSLAVEEQFYLAWPALLLVGGSMLRIKAAAWRVILLVIVVVSFAAAVVELGVAPNRAFYLPYSRAWELAVGALVFFMPPLRHRWLRESMPLLGLAAILTAACTLNPQAPFPGFNALAPVLGAALVIYPRESAAGRLLSGRPFVFVGLISYSLYLWHWPIIVFWRVYKNGIPLSSADEIAVTALSFFLSALSWRFIEQPARRIRVGSATVLTGALIAAATVAAVLVPVLWTGGFPSRLPADALALGSKAEMWDWKCPLSIDLGMLVYPNTTGSVPSCALGANWKTAHHRAIVWGDSIAESIEPLLDVAGRQERVAIAFMPACLVITNQGAPRRIMPSGPEYDKWCDAARTRVLAILSAHPEIDLVLMSTSWSFAPGLLDWRSLPNGTELMKAGLDGLLSDMEAAGRRTLIVGDIPAFLGPDPTSCVMALHALPRMPCPRDPEFIPRSTIPFETSAHAALKEVAAAHAHATVIDPLDFLCDDVRCRTYVAGEFIYRDAVHLRRNLRPETISALAELFQFRPFFAR